MRMIFISSLRDCSSTGPMYSVPARIAAQSLLDDVFWINFDADRKEWKKLRYYHNAKDLDKIDAKSILKIFPNADVVVFEGYFFYDHVKLSKQFLKLGIPYIIVPRCSLTHQAMNNHSRVKKYIANKLVFNRYCKNAMAIQYLTVQEYKDSGNSWNSNHIIIPNGIYKKNTKKTIFNTVGIKAVFIGRIDVYQKGIDSLLNACKLVEKDLRKSHFQLTLYGPKEQNYWVVDSMIKKMQLSDFIKLGGEILGMEKERVLMESDLFVLTSRFEGHPMGLIEALSYGIPALVTPGSNMHHEIEKWNAGWVCETSPSDIAKMLIIILQSKSTFMIKGEQAYTLSQEYDWNLLAGVFHEKVIELIKGM